MPKAATKRRVLGQGVAALIAAVPSPKPAPRTRTARIRLSHILLRLRLILYLCRRSLAVQTLPDLIVTRDEQPAREYLDRFPAHPRWWHTDAWDCTQAALIDLKDGTLFRQDRDQMERWRNGQC